MLTVSRKSERLVNLTIALLATKRYLTKSEIFRTVDGYEGTPEAMERMFERDKDDLRGLGITIELGTFDPLFEDEAGYRITPASYQLDLGKLEPQDIAILSLAASAWSGAALEKESTSALVKLQSLGVESDSDSLSILAPRIGAVDPNFKIVTDAILRRAQISFNYIGSDLSTSRKEIWPYSLKGDKGSWYLIGEDIGLKENRTFRLDRIQGDVTASKRNEMFTLPEQIETFDYGQFRLATLKVRKNRGFQLRNLAINSSESGEWDLIEIPIVNSSWLISSILWHLDDVEVVSPSDLRAQVIENLEQMRALHV